MDRDMDIEEAQQFLDFLKEKLDISSEEAFEIIYYLQETARLIADNYELCGKCEKLYDSSVEGHHNAQNDNFHCDGCMDADDLKDIQGVKI